MQEFMISPKKQLQNVIGYDAPQEEGFVMKLDFNENLIGPSKKVLKAIKNIKPEKVQFYPAYNDLIKAIADFQNVSESMVLPTNGADEAINYIVNTFVEPDENIITAVPTFVMSKVYSRITGCEFREIEYKEKWKYPIEDVLAAIDEKTKLIVVTTPNSPTTELIEAEDLERIIDAAPQAMILVDETYASYADISYSDYALKYDNVAVIKSMSKDFALAGLRLGYIISNENNIKAVKTIANPYSVNAVAAIAGVTALEDVEHFENVKKEITEVKEILERELESIATVYPSDANFLCVDFGDKAQVVYDRLLANGIKTKLYTEGIMKNHFRLTIPSKKQVKQLLKVLKPETLVAFDMDGVLINVENSYRLATKKTFEYFSGMELDTYRIQEAKNQGGLNNDWDLTEHLLEQSGIIIDKQEIINKFQEFYFGANNDGKGGFIENEELLIKKDLLEKLSQKHSLAVFTGRPRKEAEYSLKYFGLRKYFSEVITMDDLEPDKQKPDPKGLCKIITSLQGKKVYYLGDTPDDMMCADLAFANGVGIMPPQDKSKELKNLLKSHGAMVVLNNVNEIAKLRELK